MVSLFITASIYPCRAWKDQGGHQEAGAYLERVRLDPRCVDTPTELSERLCKILFFQEARNHSQDPAPMV